MTTTLFTIGYEGLSLEQFMRLLLAYGIELLIDVRDLPISRKKGFSKKSLSLAVVNSNKSYLHIKSLGCPPNIRHEYQDDKNWTRYAVRYNKFLKQQVAALEELSRIVAKRRCALLCFEADAERCHRSLIVQELKQYWNTELDVVHIRAEQIAGLSIKQ